MKVLVTEDVEASADRVWELVRGFGDILKWSGGAIESIEVEGEGIGAVRTLGIAGGAQLQEKLEAHDDAARSFSYSFTGKVLLPLQDYYATLTVVESGESSRVEWGSTFEPDGVSEEQARGMVEGIYQNGIAGIKKALA
jgi:carbon monoxide dehydrogenase subunit G